MKWYIGLLLVAGTVSGCSAEFFATRLGSVTRQTITCHCAQEQAAAYAVQALIDLGYTPVFTNASSLNAVWSNVDGLTVTKLDVVIEPLEASTSTLRVRAESVSPEGMDAQVAKAFVTAFEEATQ